MSDKKEFRKDYGVFVCQHVHQQQAPVLCVLRDAEGDWQFLCGDEDADSQSDAHLVAVGELLARDASLNMAVELDINEGIDRADKYSPWEGFILAEDEE